MPAIEVDLESRLAINKAHAEFTSLTGRIETMAEGPPVFSNGVATHLTMIVSEEFARFLSEKGLQFKVTDATGR